MKANWNAGNMSESQEYDPANDALTMCKAIQTGQAAEYIEWLNKRPTREIVSRLLGIIDTKSSLLPILFMQEQPPVEIDGILVDHIQNSQARMFTKITLMLLIESASKRMGVWGNIRKSWEEKYHFEVKYLVLIMGAIVKQLEDSGQIDSAGKLRKAVEGVKESNKKFGIKW